jgi:DNA modification methylase
VETEANVQLAQQDAVAWLASLPSESVDLLITDPPYESLEKHRAVGTTTRLKVSAASSNPWFTVFPNARFGELFAEVARVLKRNAHFYLMCDPETAFIAKPIAEAAGFKFWKPLVWDKCLGPETPVRTARGVIAAKEVHPGDRVYTPDGRLVAVLATRETVAPSVRIALSTGAVLKASKDHRFVHEDGSLAEAGSLRAGVTLAHGSPGLTSEVRELRIDRLLEDDEKVGLLESSTGGSQLRLQNDAAPWFEPTIALDYGWGKLIGLFAAEGWRSEQNVTFSLHRDEKHLQDLICRMARSLGVGATITESSDRGVSVNVSSKVFSKVVGHFVGGADPRTKLLLPAVYEAPSEFRRGVFDGILEADGHWSHEEQRETVDLTSLDLAAFVLRFARSLGWEATIRRQENDHAGFWRVHFDPAKRARPITVVSVEPLGECELVDIAIDDANQLYELYDGTVTHNCTIGMGYHYRARYEFVLFFEKGKRKLNDLGIADVLTAPRVRGGYPAEKPVQLSETLILQSSSALDVVADPFMGSGSVGVAALKLSRRFLGNDVSDAALARARARFAEVGGQEGAVIAADAPGQRRLSLVLP